jgi:hypothetical protein
MRALLALPSLLALGAASLAFGATFAGAADAPPPKGLEELWQRYPLGTKKLAPLKPGTASKPAPPATPAPASRPALPAPPAPPLVAKPSSSGPPVPLWAVLLAALALSCLLALGGETILARSRRSLRRFRRRVAPAPPPEPVFEDGLVVAAVARLREAAEALPVRDARLVAIVDAAGASSEWRPLALATAVEALESENGHSPSTIVEEPMSQSKQSNGSRPAVDAGDVADRVARVLLAAEEVAERIRQQAREEAAVIRGAAESAAAAQILELTQAAREQHEKAEAYYWDLRETSQAYALERRREAEAQAERLVAEAVAQAQAIRAAAEDEARGDGAREPQVSLTEALGTIGQR